MNRVELDNIVDRMVNLLGAEKLLTELTQAQSSDELEANLEHIDRMNDLGLMGKTYDDFKSYPGYAGKYIIENYIRHTYYDSVMDVFDTLEDAEDYMDSNELWDDAILLGVNHDGQAFYPSY